MKRKGILFLILIPLITLILADVIIHRSLGMMDFIVFLSLGVGIAIGLMEIYEHGIE